MVLDTRKTFKWNKFGPEVKNSKVKEIINFLPVVYAIR